MAGKSNGRRMPCARAQYNFAGQNDHELTFSTGVSIRLLRRIDDNWLEGQLGGKVGIFPANHVKIELGSPSLSYENALAKSGKPFAIALYSFDSEYPGDLSFGKGEMVELVGPAGSGWLRGCISEQEGIFPASFVEIIKPPASAEEPRPIPKPRSRSNKTVQSSLASSTSFARSLPNGSPRVSRDPLLTPSRSAPAPPTSDHQESSSSKEYSSATLPKPKPRKKLSRRVSLSDTEQHLHTLEQSLVIEQKMLESAQNLLKICQSEAKQEKLQEALETHQTNADRLRHQIREVKAQKESLVAAQSRPPPPPSPPPNTILHEPVSQEHQRAKVIEELLFTEKDFHHQMRLCCEKLVPALKEIPDIDALFGNIEEVTKLSSDFLAALQENRESVGRVFVTYAPQMREVYGAYCRNHDTAAAVMEKCMESPIVAEKMRTCLDVIRHEVQAWDLQSLLIKPVQRVLKYPLLLDKLIETTALTHPDHKAVNNARDAIGQVAQDINEIKRRKDLVRHYTDAERRGTVSMHSIQKKVRRFQQVFTQLTGLRSKTVDTKFDEVEQRVLGLEALLRALVRDIQGWQEEMQHVLESRESLGDGMGLYCSNCQTLSNFQSLLPGLQQALKTHGQFVSEHVLVPLQTLLGLFQDPLYLIQKRGDKLLDYDHTQYALERAEEPDKIRQLREDCLMAKRNYEALNAQLLEELPHFLQLALNLLQHTLTVLVHAQYSFYSAVCNLLEPVSETIEQSLTIQHVHAQEIAAVAQKLVHLSLVPASLAMNFTTRPKRPSEDSPLLPHSAHMYDIQEEPLEDPPEGTQLEVLYDFEAQDRAELSVGVGQVVVLICPHDRIGCREWWLVEAESGKGYVPATYLAVCCESADNSR